MLLGTSLLQRKMAYVQIQFDERDDTALFSWRIKYMKMYSAAIRYYSLGV